MGIAGIHLQDYTMSYGLSRSLQTFTNVITENLMQEHHDLCEVTQFCWRLKSSYKNMHTEF